MYAVVVAFNQEKALVGAFSVITNLRVDIRLKLYRVVVDDLEEVDAALEEVGEAGEEGDEAHEEDHELVADALGAEDVLEAVLDGGDDDLDHGELAVDAEDDEHEEEDDGPELRTNQR